MFTPLQLHIYPGTQNNEMRRKLVYCRYVKRNAKLTKQTASLETPDLVFHISADNKFGNRNITI